MEVVVTKWSMSTKENHQKSNHYLTCTNSKRGGECTQSKHFRYFPLEHMLIHLATANGFMPKPEEPNDLNQQKESLAIKKDQTNNKLTLLLEKDFTAPAILSKIEELTVDVDILENKIKEIDDKLLTIKPDYNYEELYHDVVKETDLIKKYHNRVVFNSYINQKIDKAYLYSTGLFPCIVFKMCEKGAHTLILDELYNFGGCTIPNGKDKLIRLNGEGLEPVDEMI